MRLPRPLLLLLVVAVLVPAPAAHAAHTSVLPTGNDAFADRVPLTTDVTALASTWSATPDPGEPASTCDATADDPSVWFTWTAPDAGTFVVDTYSDSPYGVQFSTAITVFTGATLGALAETACDSGTVADISTAAGESARVQVVAAQGDTYAIRVAPQEGGTPGSAPITVRSVSSPANDDFGDAAAIDALPFSSTGWFHDADVQAGELVPSCEAAATGTVWFTHTPAVDGRVLFQTTLSDRENHLVVATGASVDALTEVVCDGDGKPAFSEGSTLAGQATVDVTAGTAYHVMVVTTAASTAERGRFTLEAVSVATPTNDDIVDAIEVDLATPFEETVALTAATLEAGETCGATHSVWYQIAPSTDGVLGVETVGSDGDLEISVNTGPADADAYADLTEVECQDDDSGHTYAENLHVAVTAGTTYYVSVADQAAPVGLVPVRIALTTDAPDNDLPEGATEITSLPFVADRSIVGGTSDANSCQPAFPEVWWTWTAPASITAYATTFGSDPDTWLSVHDAADVTDAANEVVCNDDQGTTYHSGDVFTATAGTTYLVAIGGLSVTDDLGDVRLILTAGGAVAGTVTARDGTTPLADVCVQGVVADEVVSSATTAEDGTYALAGFADGDVVVRFNQCDTPNPLLGTSTTNVTAGEGSTVTADALLNQAPVAVDDLASTSAGVAVTIDVVANDVDVDGDDLVVTATTDPASGAVTCDVDGCTYTSEPGFEGTDTFEYTVSDDELTSSATVQVEVGPFLVRLSGADRYLTAIEISRATYPDLPSEVRTAAATLAQAVVVARGDEYADALAGAPLASAVSGPILLSRTAGLPDEVKAEVSRLGVTTAYLLGGTAALSEQVRTDLVTLGVTSVERIGGNDRFATAALVAEELAEVTGTQPSTAYVVEGINVDDLRGWPDAVSAGAAAARQLVPILLTRASSLPTATSDAIEEGGIPAVTIVGGQAAVNGDVEAALEAALGQDAVNRVFGDDRFGTSTELADDELGALGAPVRVWVATGLAFPDALAAGPAVAAGGDVLVLAHGLDDTRGAATYQWLADNAEAIVGVRVVGGINAVSDAVAQKVVGLVQP